MKKKKELLFLQKGQHQIKHHQKQNHRERQFVIDQLKAHFLLKFQFYLSKEYPFLQAKLNINI